MKGKRLCIPEVNRVVVEEFEIVEGKVGAHHVLVETLYTLISPGTEGAIFTALDEGVHNPEAWCHYPFKPGYANVGRVLKVGDGVENVKEGDTFFSMAGHASVALVNTKAMNTLVVPSGVDPQHVLLLRMAGVAITAMRTATFELGEWVVVVGLGLVGNFAAQLLGLRGANVLGTDLSEKRLTLAQMCGVRWVVNPANEDAVETVKQLTDGEGAHCVIDAIGNPNLVLDIMALARKNSELVLLGSPRGRSKIDGSDVLSQCHLRGVTIKGALEWLYPRFPSGDGRPSIQENYELLLDLLQMDKLKVDGLITHVLPPEEAQSGYEGLRDKKDEYLGVVFKWAE